MYYFKNKDRFQDFVIATPMIVNNYSKFIDDKNNFKKCLITTFETEGNIKIYTNIFFPLFQRDIHGYIFFDNCICAKFTIFF